MSPRKTNIDQPKRPLAATYIRVSTHEQAREGVSLASQAEAVELYCRLRGVPLGLRLEDRGVSAATPLGERPDGCKLLDPEAMAGVTIIVAVKLDRIFRDAQDALNVAEEWRQRGIELHLVNQGGTTLDTGTAMGKMIFTMFAAFAEMERNLIRERIKDALATLKAQGVSLGRAPLGYQHSERRNSQGRRVVEPVESELAIVGRIQDMSLAGFSLSDIARTLEADGAPTKRGGRWWHGTVSRVLRRQTAR